MPAPQSEPRWRTSIRCRPNADEKTTRANTPANASTAGTIKSIRVDAGVVGFAVSVAIVA
jgi:hypothetical protein